MLLRGVCCHQASDGVSRRLSGIEEHLRRWGWRLPEGYAPVRLEDCRKCHELVLVVRGAGRDLKLNRDGTPHMLHPRTTSLP